MTSFNEYKERKKKEEIENIKIIDSADLAAVERHEERIISDAFDLPKKEDQIDYSLCKEYDKKEYEKFQEAGDKLLEKVSKNLSDYFD